MTMRPFLMQKRHPLLYRFVVLGMVSAGVYLLFRYLLGMLFPFLFAYLTMRMLFPVIWFLQHRWRMPRWFACGATLTAFFGIVFGGLGLLLWQGWKQLRLFLQNFPAYRQCVSEMYARQTGQLCRKLDGMLKLADGSSYGYLSVHVKQAVADGCNAFSAQAGSMLTSCFSWAARCAAVVLIIVVSMIALCTDMQEVHRMVRRSLFYMPLHRVAAALKKSGVGYMKSQGIIFLVIWLICSVALMLIRNPYSLLIGCGIAVFDTFPILGSGMILVPWAVYAGLQQRYWAAAILFAAFLLCVVGRDLLEAHLMGSHMGLLPFFMTAALYIGVCLFGVWGIVLGPFGVILIRAVYALFFIPSPLMS